MTPRFARHLDVLPGGLRLCTVELPHLHTASLVMYAKVGSRFEDQRDNGLSHFLEHMLFRGTATHPDAYRLNYAIESLGGTLYAETARDYSLYQLSLHPDTLAPGMALLAELFHAPVFEGLEVERRIILEEILEDLDEDGGDINVDDVARAAAFPDHPLGYKITGPYANVERFTLADVQRHFRRCYGARNLVLTVAGAVEHGAVLEQARAVMSAIPAGEALAVSPPATRSDGPQLRTVENSGSQTSLQVLFRAVPETSADYPALTLLSRVLDDGMSTRLHHRICDELGLAYYVSGGIDSFSDAALFEIDASSAHANVPAVLRESLALLSALRERAPAEAEIDKAKRRYRWDLEASFDDPDSMAGWWGGTELYYRPSSFEEKLERLNAVTGEDVRRVAEQVFRRDTLTVAAVGQLDDRTEDQMRRTIETFR